MRRLFFFVVAALLCALPTWAALADEKKVPFSPADLLAVEMEQRSKETPLQTAKRLMISACTSIPVNVQTCNALVNFYRAMREDR